MWTLGGIGREKEEEEVVVVVIGNGRFRDKICLWGVVNLLEVLLTVDWSDVDSSSRFSLPHTPGHVLPLRER